MASGKKAIGVLALLGLGLLALGSRRAKADDGKIDDPAVEPPKKWGDFEVPDWFDVNSNAIYVDPQCRGVIEGRKFLPAGFGLNAEEAPTLAEVLALSPDNSVFGYVDRLLDTENIAQGLSVDEATVQIAWRTLAQASPFCFATPPAQWGAGLTAWFASFRQRIRSHVAESIGGIGDFNP